MSEIIDYKNAAVELQSIDFTYEEINIKNSSMLIVPFAPAWTPKNLSCAAYSIKDTKEALANDELQIWARFEHDDEKVFANIKATPFIPDDIDSLYSKRGKKFINGNVLGDVQETAVYFGSSGQSSRHKDSNVPLPIKGANFTTAGVYDIFWLWEYQEMTADENDNLVPLNPEVWIPFETTMHRIFVTLEEPKSPWTAYPFRDIFEKDYSKTPVWTGALLWACDWAQGTETIEDAGKAIAKGLFNSEEFTYEFSSLYHRDTLEKEEDKLKLATNTTSFFLSKIIERLQGGEGETEFINCVDCALTVATLTNLLGGDLHIGTLQGTDIVEYSSENALNNRFEVKSIKAIGMEIDTTMEKLKVDDKYYFGNHTIAWMAPIKEDSDAEQPNEELIRATLLNGETISEDLKTAIVPDFDNAENIVFDGCLEFVIGETLVSAAGIQIGKEGDPGYLASLATPCQEHGIVKCIPQPITVRTIRIV